MKKAILTISLLMGLSASAQFFGYHNNSLKSPPAGRTKQGRAGIDICNNGPVNGSQNMCADSGGVIGKGSGFSCSNWCNLAAPNTGCRASAGSNGLNAECQAWCVEVNPPCTTTPTDDM
jgi:hypothetical protein